MNALLACVLMVAQAQGLPPRVLVAIQAAEGGTVGAIRRNANGSEDFGLMQVNSVWLDPVARVTGLPPGEVRARLIGDGCFSIAVAGAILRMHWNATGDLMRAIGNYHSRTPALNQAYQARVLERAIRLFGQTAPAR